MIELILYSVKVSVCIILFYGIYRTLLHKETHFGFNRAYLVISITVSLIIPALSISINPQSEVSVFASVLQSVQVGPEKIITTGSGLSFLNYIIIIYFLGVVLLLLRFMSQLGSIMLMHQHCRIEMKNGIRIAISTKPIAPFSFLHTVYINEKMMNEKQLDKIVMHETIHIRQFHSVDVVFIEIVCILTWFNPVSWIVKAALKETHEYLADSGVSEQTSGSAEYLMLLIRTAFGIQPDLANNFNKSLTLKRLNMMKKKRSGSFSMLKAIPVMPLIALLLIAFSCKNSAGDTKSDNSTVTNKTAKVEAKVEKMPEFPGGQAAMSKFIIDNVKYPEAAKKEGIQGKVMVTFTVTSSGKLDKIKVSQKVNDLLDNEAIRVVSLMPAWIPGESDGKPVDVEVTLPVQFKLQ